jgi:hypothetical protein
MPEPESHLSVVEQAASEAAAAHARELVKRPGLQQVVDVARDVTEPAAEAAVPDVHM